MSHVPVEITLRDIFLRELRKSSKMKHDLETYERAKDGTKAEGTHVPPADSIGQGPAQSREDSQEQTADSRREVRCPSTQQSQRLVPPCHYRACCRPDRSSSQPCRAALRLLPPCSNLGSGRVTSLSSRGSVVGRICNCKDTGALGKESCCSCSACPGESTCRDMTRAPSVFISLVWRHSFSLRPHEWSSHPC